MFVRSRAISERQSTATVCWGMAFITRRARSARRRRPPGFDPRPHALAQEHGQPHPVATRQNLTARFLVILDQSQHLERDPGRQDRGARACLTSPPPVFTSRCWLHLENWFMLEALDKELTIAQLKSEFGLVSLDEHLARAEWAQGTRRKV
jgi:hypothetical protein